MKNTEQNDQKLELVVTERTEKGKTTIFLRKQGIIPGNIFGADFKSLAVSVNQKEFNPIYKIAQETGIVYLKVNDQSIPTLVKHIQRHSVTDAVLHIDFRKVNLKQKMETIVPIQVEGDSLAVHQLAGVLLIQSAHLTIEALPQNIPAHIIVDISTIIELGQEIRVKDLALSKDYTIIEDPEKVVVSVVEHKEESLEAETDVDAPEITTTAKEEEGAEADGEDKKPDKKQEK